MVLDHYGRVCACCHETNTRFLVVDHINGGGRQHVKKVGPLYPWLIRNKFPSGFRVLCDNCNMGRALAGGVCPHSRFEEKQSVPTYDFVCSNGHVTEELHSASKAPNHIECFTCHQPARRQLGAGSTPIFKGSGFYQTDYKAQKPPEPPPA